MKITIKQMRVFDAIARYGNVSHAADEIALSQSAASMALKDLEQHLGAQLFQRHGKRLQLNDYGRWLQPKVHQLLQQVEEIEQSAKSDQLQGHLKIGASTTIGNYILPALIADFVRQHPGVEMDLRVANTEQVIDDMLNLRVDIGLIEGICHSHQLVATAWRRDRLAVFCSPTHALTQHAHLSLADLRHQQWILREEGSGTREIFALATRNQLEPLQVILKLGDSEAIKQAVKTGLGLGCLSQHAVQAEFDHGELAALPLDHIDLQRTLYQVQPKRAYTSHLLQSFIDHINDKTPS